VKCTVSYLCQPCRQLCHPGGAISNCRSLRFTSTPVNGACWPLRLSAVSASPESIVEGSLDPLERRPHLLLNQWIRARINHPRDVGTSNSAFSAGSSDLFGRLREPLAHTKLKASLEARCVGKRRWARRSVEVARCPGGRGLASFFLSKVHKRYGHNLYSPGKIASFSEGNAAFLIPERKRQQRACKGELG
jgi:hypothetical protein